MLNTILGVKQNMIVKFSKQGARVAVTNVMVEPNIVLKVDSSKAVIGLGKRKKVKKTDNFYVKSVGFMPRFIKEVKLAGSQVPIKQTGEEEISEIESVKPGDLVTLSIFEPGDEVKITGTTKGKGFAGGVKRWGFSGGPKTHGQSDRHRAPGSIGSGTTPGRVWKGKKMAGHMGASKITINGLEVIDIDVANNILAVKGAIPGSRNDFLVIEKTGKVKGYTPPPDPNEEKQAEKEGKSQAHEAKKEAPEVAKSAQDSSEAKGELKMDFTPKSSELSDVKEGDENAS